ncbi:MAG: lysoplasmalogenase [Oscillospiraceae bacterium]|nr:lysoplasmalogenase [Oscillospiraceae bacterium]
MSTSVIILALAGMLAQAIFIAAEHKEKYVHAVILKGSAALIFCSIGLTAMAEASNLSFAKLIVLGLHFGALGDVLLNLRFVFPKKGQKIFLAGVAAFLTGHILYLCAIMPLSENLAVCLIAGVILAAALLAWIFRTLTVKLAFKIFGVLYIGAIVLMTAVAVGNVIAVPHTAAWMHAVGAVLFTLSDIVLIFNTFGTEQKFSLRITNLSLYYLGQLLIASSLFFI